MTAIYSKHNNMKKQQLNPEQGKVEEYQKQYLTHGRRSHPETSVYGPPSPA